MMQIIKLTLFFCCTSFAMQQPNLTLDDKGMAEFKTAKQKLHQLGSTVKNSPSNRLLAHYRKLATMNPHELSDTFAQCQTVIKELYDNASKDEQCKKKYNEALTINNDTTWDDWRKANGCTMMTLLKTKGITFAFPSLQFIEANPNLNDDQLTYITASSFLLYYARQKQREITKKDLSPIDIK